MLHTIANRDPRTVNFYALMLSCGISPLLRNSIISHKSGSLTCSAVWSVRFFCEDSVLHLKRHPFYSLALHQPVSLLEFDHTLVQHFYNSLRGHRQLHFCTRLDRWSLHPLLLCHRHNYTSRHACLWDLRVSRVALTAEWLVRRWAQLP